MTKKARSAPAPAPDSDPLAEAVNRLSDELCRLSDLIDHIREDFSWVTRNGLPVQAIEHVHVKRMALDPCAGDWRERLEIERSTYPANASALPLDAEALDQIAESLTTTVEAVAQGQLEAVLQALDVVRNQILAAVEQKPTEPHAPTAPATAAPLTAPSQRAKPPTGRLF